MFDASSIAKDAAQTTIPYIDAQNVSPVSGVWITGIGLYHKGYIGYGGYGHQVRDILHISDLCNLIFLQIKGYLRL